MITIENEVTIADLDECIKNVNDMLKTDTFGNRMTWQKRQMLQSSLDDLLDARWNLMQTGNAVID